MAASLLGTFTNPIQVLVLKCYVLVVEPGPCVRLSSVTLDLREEGSGFPSLGLVSKNLGVIPLQCASSDDHFM